LSYWPEATHLGDLLRLSVRPGAGRPAPPGFQGPMGALRTPRKPRCSAGGHNLASGRTDYKGCAQKTVKEEREPSPEPPSVSPGSPALPPAARPPARGSRPDSLSESARPGRSQESRERLLLPLIPESGRAPSLRVSPAPVLGGDAAKVGLRGRKVERPDGDLHNLIRTPPQTLACCRASHVLGGCR
jgi:hypothetical protein